METTIEEKQKLQDLEFERIKQLNNIMRIRANDPPGLDKGDPNKVWCYKTTADVVCGKVDALGKVPKKFLTLKI